MTGERAFILAGLVIIIGGVVITGELEIATILAPALGLVALL